MRIKASIFVIWKDMAHFSFERRIKSDENGSGKEYWLEIDWLSHDFNRENFGSDISSPRNEKPYI